MSVAPPEGGRNRIMIYGPKPDGTYIVEFKTADGEALAIGMPAGETPVLKNISKSECRTVCSCRKFPERTSGPHHLAGRARNRRGGDARQNSREIGSETSGSEPYAKTITLS